MLSFYPPPSSCISAPLGPGLVTCGPLGLRRAGCVLHPAFGRLVARLFALAPLRRAFGVGVPLLGLCLLAFALGHNAFRLTRRVDLRPSFRQPFVREVQAGELAEQFDGHAIVRPGRLHLIVKVPAPVSFSFESALCEPLAKPRVIEDAFEPGERWIAGDILLPMGR